MPEVNFFLDGDGGDLADWMQPAPGKPTPKVRHINDGLRIVRLKDATHGGHNAVSVCARSPSGQVIVLEMTERLFLMAAYAIQERSRADGTMAPDIVDDGGDIQVPNEAIAKMTPEQLARYQAMLDRQLGQVLARSTARPPAPERVVEYPAVEERKPGEKP